jgi:hypothetical protein
MNNEKPILGIALALIIFAGLLLLNPGNVLKNPAPAASLKALKNLPLSNPPKIIKAVYFTAISGGSQKKLDYLSRLVKETKINAVVIDIKDYSGYVAYDTGLPEVEKYKTARITIHDVDSLIRQLHSEGIYAIARMVIFQDPALAYARPDLAVKNGQRIWTDRKGLAWIDPAAKDAWDYNIAIAQNAVSKGFDEINIDYVRFPSDGNTGIISYPFWDKKATRPEILSAFFQKFREGLPDTKLSVDLFGFVMNKTQDFGVGQVLEDALKYFNYISPMVYPSHYPPTYLGFANPADYPYEIIKSAMDSGVVRLTAFKQATGTHSPTFRPWIQDFNLGANYDAAKVEAEEKAVTDSMKDGFVGFMVWNPSNVYTEAAFH